MKKFLFVVLAAVLGAVVALSGAKYLGWGEQVKYVEVPAPATVSTNFSNFADPAPRVVPAPTEGFVTAAERSLPAVVHIKASKSVAGNRSRGGGGQNPFGLSPDALRDFFGLPEDGQGGGDPRGQREMPLQQGSGSGVIISPDGYIVSNNHVVEGAENLEVVLNDQRTYTATVIGTDPTTDIALIKIDDENLPTVQFADSDKVKVGEWVVAVGNPFSLTNTVTAGIVSAKGRSIDIVRRSGGELAIESFIQTDAVVNPGNSGGALVNQNGDLIGINTAISSPTGVFAGYSFAVPSAIVKKVVEDLREYGIVQRGLLGAVIRPLDAASAKELDIDRNDGVYVVEVRPESAAEDAGVEVGDVILKVDGVKTVRSSTLLEQLGRRRPGDDVTLTIERDGRQRDVSVRLKNESGDTGIVRPEEKPEVFASLGVDFEDLSAEDAKELDLKGGVVVTNVKSGPFAEQTRMAPGFIITKVNDRPVGNAKELAKMLKNGGDMTKVEGIYPNAPDKPVRYGVAQ